MTRGSAVAPNFVDATHVVPTGRLIRLAPADVRPNPNNPRLLFDPEPMKELRENIRVHGVLVPITVYPLPGQEKYGILDGARRHHCCVELEKQGLDISIPANVVNPPDKMAGLLYMFSIHNFREAWELMPTALSLKIVIEELGETDSKVLNQLTGLSEPQIERCKLLLTFNERFQVLSLEPNPKERIPSNFWIEASPVLDLVEEALPKLAAELTRDGVTDRLVDKYRRKKIKSVIHFRRIIEAYEVAGDDARAKEDVASKLEEYINNPDLETRKAFDGFVVDNRRVQSAIKASESFLFQLVRGQLEHVSVDREPLIRALTAVKVAVTELLERLSGSDAPGTGEMDGAGEAE
jgi:ParB family chromosome partitioning protein